MADFELFESFNIDDGQLDGLSPQQCFVLGYELAEITYLLKKPQCINKYVHAENKERIQALCDKCHRYFTLKWAKEDESESWLFLIVH